MKQRLLICLVMLAVPAFGQIKDMPTQAEFDPILENADSKLKAFEATLTEFKAEATVMNKSKLDGDLNAIHQLLQMVELAHSGSGNHGMNLTRAYSIVTSLDDVTLDAAAWSSLNLAYVGQGKGSERNTKFGMQMDMDFLMLEEVSRQMFHPAFRLIDTANEYIATSDSAAPNTHDGESLLRECQAADDAYCNGLISGIMDTHSILGQIEDRLGGTFIPYFCTQTGVPAAATVVKYLKDHPSELHEPETMLVMMALASAFPCAGNK